jgi:hypothetical protein
VPSIDTRTVAQRISSLDWKCLEEALDQRGWGLTGPLLTPPECSELIDSYDEPNRYRSRVVMARHNFGLGEYKYYNYPLPDLVEALRTEIYPFLATTANRWSQAMGLKLHYPQTLPGMLKLCHEAGQHRPTPLILRYGKNDYNCLHQDLYGDLHFPLQLAVLLSSPSKDFDGGEFVLTEQRPRMQSRVQVVPLTQGHGVVFAVNQRPVKGKRGFYRVTMRHGVSPLRSGNRYTLGLIFHDAS